MGVMSTKFKEHTCNNFFIHVGFKFVTFPLFFLFLKWLTAAVSGQTSNYLSQISYNLFYYRLIVHQIPSNYNCCKLYKILIVLDGVSNDNEIV
jgi:hypothetical protein